ncbi:MAG: hypothetical protein ACOX6J_04455 [Oscillospiraceae bacterium]|jgi:hypothetical protein
MPEGSGALIWIIIYIAVIAIAAAWSASYKKKRKASAAGSAPKAENQQAVFFDPKPGKSAEGRREPARGEASAIHIPSPSMDDEGMFPSKEGYDTSPVHVAEPMTDHRHEENSIFGIVPDAVRPDSPQIIDRNGDSTEQPRQERRSSSRKYAKYIVIGDALRPKYF